MIQTQLSKTIGCFAFILLPEGEPDPGHQQVQTSLMRAAVIYVKE